MAEMPKKGSVVMETVFLVEYEKVDDWGITRQMTTIVIMAVSPVEAFRKLRDYLAEQSKVEVQSSSDGRPVLYVPANDTVPESRNYYLVGHDEQIIL